MKSLGEQIAFGGRCADDGLATRVGHSFVLI